MLKELELKLSNAFKDLVFIEKTHQYFLDDENLISVSRKIDAHCEKFDADKPLGNGYTLIEASAKKQTRLRGETVTSEELRKEWVRTNKDACDLGHETHDYLEHFNGLKTPKTPQERAGVKFLQFIFSEYITLEDGTKIPRYILLAKEIRMFSRKRKYAGTADLLLYDNLLGGIVIADYKTNGNLFKTYGFLLEPFNWMESHPYNKYQIQLSYYQIMLEEVGFKVVDRMLIYLRGDETFTPFSTVDLTTELKQIMDNPKVLEHTITESFPLW